MSGVKRRARPRRAPFRFSDDGRDLLRDALGSRTDAVAPLLEEIVGEYLQDRAKGWRGWAGLVGTGQSLVATAHRRKAVAIAAALRILIRRIDEAGEDFEMGVRLQNTISAYMSTDGEPPSEGAQLRSLRQVAQERLRAIAPATRGSQSTRGPKKNVWLRALVDDVALLLYLQGFEVRPGRETTFGRVLRAIDFEIFAGEAGTEWGTYRLSREAATDVNKSTPAEWRRTVLTCLRQGVFGYRACSFWRRHITLQ
jgi:hypothetical protein